MAAIVATLAVAVVAWVFTVVRMNWMDMGPGTDLGPFSFFIVTWIAMMAAMMLPSALPSIAPFRRTVLRASGVSTVISSVLFAVGYIGAWAAVGVFVFAVYNAVGAAHLSFLASGQGRANVAGAAVVLAGLYELTLLKRACLDHCRSTTDRPLGQAAASGLRYGASCVGCSAGLMLVLIALGVMSLTWMLVIAVLLFLEKVPPVGPRLVLPIAVLLIGLGLGIAVAPTSVPWLTMPQHM